MAKKRSVFDIDFDLDSDVTPETTPDAKDEGFPAGNQAAPETKSFRDVQGHPLQNVQGARRGPMASAISEAADASSERAKAEANIRAENDALAHEHVRLKKLGLITDLLPTDEIKISKLTRDRAETRDPELEDLKTSILAVGLSNPIRVEQTDDGYELIQGFRRLSAFQEIAAETGDKRYLKIPAALVPRGEPLVDLYRKMVDENLVRKDISFGEMAQLALSYASDTGGDVADAVGELYASARKQKRTYIRNFARLLELTEGAISHVDQIPRALGLDLYKLLDQEPERAGGLIAALRQKTENSAEEELAALRKFLVSVVAKPEQAAKKTTAKTSLRLTRPEGDAKVVAVDGRIELRLDRDFSGLSKAQLQRGIELLLDALDQDSAADHQSD